MMYRKRQEERREEERRRRPPLRPDFEIDYQHPEVIIPDVGSTMPGIIGKNVWNKALSKDYANLGHFWPTHPLYVTERVTVVN